MKVNSELENLIPRLTSEEYNTLEKSILNEGVREPLVIWQGYIVDGHNRYEIAQKHGVEFKTVEKEFRGIDDVKLWMIDNQKGRRNLSKASWLDLGFKKAELLRPRAKENQGKRTDIFQESEKSYEPVNTTAEAAKYAGVSTDTASKYKKVIESDNEDIKQKVKNGDVSINRAYEEMKKPHVSNNSGENEWYTPIKYINAARKVMGSIDLDPASSRLANETVCANKYFSIEDDGLTKEWFGNVWMNPPYAQPLINEFCGILKKYVESGAVGQAIVLVNNATETVWFKTLISISHYICFPKGRIRFIDKEGKEGNSPLQGQCILYTGDSGKRFKEVFKEFGWIAKIEV